MPPAWKADIIALTEGPEARAAKIDASFFPPVSPEGLASWEEVNRVTVPGEIRSYLLQSDGLESARGMIWPVLPLARWEVSDDPCASAHPWIRFGESATHRYLLSLGHSPSIYRHEIFGTDEEFFPGGSVSDPIPADKGMGTKEPKPIPLSQFPCLHSAQHLLPLEKGLVLSSRICHDPAPP
jgi:hypothetical protein